MELTLRFRKTWWPTVFAWCYPVMPVPKRFQTIDRDCTAFDYRRCCIYNDIGKWGWWMSSFQLPLPSRPLTLWPSLYPWETVRQRIDNGEEHRDCGRPDWCYAIDRGEKSHRTWTKSVRSHQHPFLAEGYTLDGPDPFVEVPWASTRTWHGNWVYLQTTAASQWTIMTLWSIGTTVCSFYKRALFV